MVESSLRLRTAAVRDGWIDTKQTIGNKAIARPPKRARPEGHIPPASDQRLLGRQPESALAGAGKEVGEDALVSSAGSGTLLPVPGALVKSLTGQASRPALLI